jgi:alpha-beta hydrolase superfamily lysophospholipase
MLDAGRYCLEHAGELSIPALIMHGGRDTITDPVATRAFAQKAPGCTLQEWPAGKHELHQMSCGKEIIAVASDWIVARCPVSTADNDKQASIARPGN